MMFQTVAANTLISAAARLFGGVLALVSIGIVTRSLGPGFFGEYSAILAFLYLFSIAADLGLYQYVLRESSRPGANERSLFSVTFSIRLAALSVILSIGVVAALVFVPLSPASRIGIPLAAVAFWLQSLVQLSMAPLQKRLKAYWAALAEIAGRVLQLGLSVIIAVLGGSVVLFLVALVASSFLQFAVHYRAVRQYLPFRLSFSLPVAKGIIRESLPIAIGLLFTLVYFRMDTVMLSFLRPPEDVGLYNLAYKMLEYLIFFPAMFVGLIMPRLSLEAVENLKAFRVTLQRLFEVIMFAAMPLMIGGFFLAPLLVEALGGKDFLQAVSPLRILLVAAALIFLGNVFGSAVIALGQQRRAVWAYGIGMVLNFGLNLIFIPRFSYVAAATSTVLTEFVVTFGLMCICARASGGYIRTMRVLYALAASIVMAIPFMFLGDISHKLGIFALIPYLIICPALYILSLRMFRGITQEHIDLLRAHAVR